MYNSIIYHLYIALCLPPKVKVPSSALCLSLFFVLWLWCPVYCVGYTKTFLKAGNVSNWSCYIILITDNKCIWTYLLKINNIILFILLIDFKRMNASWMYTHVCAFVTFFLSVRELEREVSRTLHFSSVHFHGGWQKVNFNSTWINALQI